MIRVKLISRHGILNAGEIAGFEDAHAALLIEAGIAQAMPDEAELTEARREKAEGGRGRRRSETRALRETEE